MNYDTDKRHKELRVLAWERDKSGRITRDKDGYPVAKETRPSERGIVSITEAQADAHNMAADRTNLIYEIEPQPKPAKETKVESKKE